MQRYLLQCADINFIVSVGGTDLAAMHGGCWLAPYEGDVAGIHIEAEFVPLEQDISAQELNKLPPEVSINKNIMSINHPAYSGEYSLREEKASATVGGYHALIAFIRVVFSIIIVDRGGLAVHSSCIRKNDSAYIFSGHSGAGKSTVIKLTDNPALYSDEVTVVCKDGDGCFKVFHSPFRSEFYTNPLPPTGNIARLFFIRQDSRVFLEPLTKSQALAALLPNIFFPLSGRNPYEQKVFQLCSDFISQVPVRMLHFRKDNSFWRCIVDDLNRE